MSEAVSLTNLNEAVQFCGAAYQKAFNEERARQGADDYDARKKGALAFAAAMPRLTCRNNIRAFIACVTYAMALEFFSESRAGKLLYAAQIALRALPPEPRQPAGRPSKSDKSGPEPAAAPAPPPAPTPAPKPPSAAPAPLPATGPARAPAVHQASTSSRQPHPHGSPISQPRTSTSTWQFKSKGVQKLAEAVRNLHPNPIRLSPRKPASQSASRRAGEPTGQR